MSYMSELVECREAFRSRPESDWKRALQGGSVSAVEPTPSLDELFDRPGKAERDWNYVDPESGELPARRVGPTPGLEEPNILSLDVELVAPEIIDLSNDPLIMGILAGDIRTLCLDCSERDCPAHPVNGIV